MTAAKRTWTTQDEANTYSTYEVLLLRSVRTLEHLGKITAQRDALREALELVAAHTSNCIEQCRAENNASLLRVHATVVSVQIMARKALALADGAK